MEEWVSVVNYDFEGTAPKRATKKHFDLTLSQKGFVIFDPAKDADKLVDGLVPAKKGKSE